MGTDSKSACFRDTTSSLHIVTAALFGAFVENSVITLVLKMIKFFLKSIQWIVIAKINKIHLRTFKS